MKIKKSLIVMLLLSSINAFGADSGISEKEFYYEGQGHVDYNLVSKIFETKYREESVDSTCTRQIPYQKEECNYETKYRRECHTIPGRNECRQVPRQHCRQVPEQQCTREPHQVCRNESRQQCRTKQRCAIGRNGKRVCRQVRDCYPVNKRVCHTEYNRRCRTVYRRRCTTHYERECHWIPSREQCNQIPYQEYVCRTVTKYRTENYPCKKTVQIPYEDFIGDVDARVTFDFDSEFINDSNYGRIKFVTSLNQDNFQMSAKNESDIKSLIFIDEKIRKQPAGGDKRIDANYTVKLVPAAPLKQALARGIQEFIFDKKSISFMIDKVNIPHEYDLTLNLTRKTKRMKRKVNLVNRVLNSSEYTITNVGDQLKFTIDLESMDLDIPSGKRHYVINTLLLMKINNQEQIINPEDLPRSKRMSHSFKEKL